LRPSPPEPRRTEATACNRNSFTRATLSCSAVTDRKTATVIIVAVCGNARSCRGQVEPRARQDLGHAVWSVSSRELCQPRAGAACKPVTESNLSLCVPRASTVDMASCASTAARRSAFRTVPATCQSGTSGTPRASPRLEAGHRPAVASLP
jgi:hypothetical protein